VDLCVQGSSLWQSLLSQPGDGLVEDAGVFVLYEEGQVGFVVDHMGGHGGFFFYGDIGGIADDEVQGRQTGPLAAVEDIELEEIDVGYQGGGVATGDCQGFGTDITGMDKGLWKAFFQGDGDASAAGAYVQDGRGGFGLICGYPFHQLFGFGAWDKDVFVHIKFHSAEPAFLQNILYGLMF